VSAPDLSPAGRESIQFVARIMGFGDCFKMTLNAPHSGDFLLKIAQRLVSSKASTAQTNHITSLT